MQKTQLTIGETYNLGTNKYRNEVGRLLSTETLLLTHTGWGAPFAGFERPRRKSSHGGMPFLKVRDTRISDAQQAKVLGHIDIDKIDPLTMTERFIVVEGVEVYVGLYTSRQVRMTFAEFAEREEANRVAHIKAVAAKAAQDNENAQLIQRLQDALGEDVSMQVDTEWGTVKFRRASLIELVERVESLAKAEKDAEAAYLAQHATQD
jgi:hypothetical protein